MQLRRILLLMVAINSVIIVSVIVFMKENEQKTTRFSKEIDADLFAQFADFNSELTRYKASRKTGLATRKPFIYLTETEQCLPPNLADSSQIGDPENCNCDVIVLSFRAKCTEDKQSHVSYLFDPNTYFASGRNVLYFAAMERRPGYHYYIFINDDTVLKYNRFTPIAMKKLSPFRAVEKWLLDYEPAVGVLNYVPHDGAGIVLQRRRDLCGIKDNSLVLPTVFFDAIFNAFHHKAVQHILPYQTQYEPEYMFSSNRHTTIVVEVKFGGQALLFAPVTAGNPLHREYNRIPRNMLEISREFIESIKQQAPSKLRNNALFDQLHKSPKDFLTMESRSFCANVTRHQPIIPYRHLLSD
ncbi:uncharacterized protein LOC144663582 [Oculina patagonica]